MREVEERETYGLVGAETATFLTPSEERMDSIESDTTVVMCAPRRCLCVSSGVFSSDACSVNAFPNSIDTVPLPLNHFDAACSRRASPQLDYVAAAVAVSSRPYNKKSKRAYLSVQISQPTEGDKNGVLPSMDNLFA